MIISPIPILNTKIKILFAKSMYTPPKRALRTGIS